MRAGSVPWFGRFDAPRLAMFRFASALLPRGGLRINDPQGIEEGRTRDRGHVLNCA